MSASNELKVLSGPVSGMKDNVQILNGIIKFRIGGRPVLMTMSPNVIDGDLVTGAGTGDPEIELLALKVEATNVIYSVPEPAVKLSILNIIVGIITIAFLIGLFILWGTWYNYSKALARRTLIREAKRRVEAPKIKA